MPEKGLSIAYSFDEESGIHSSTLFADGITGEGGGVYFCEVQDKDGNLMDSELVYIGVY
jgi:hypothetical protein